MSTWPAKMVQALGDAGERSGVFSETAGKIYGVLYLNAGALSLDEIARQAGTSKGNASVVSSMATRLRELRPGWPASPSGAFLAP